MVCLPSTRFPGPGNIFFPIYLALEINIKRGVSASQGGIELRAILEVHLPIALYSAMQEYLHPALLLCLNRGFLVLKLYVSHHNQILRSFLKCLTKMFYLSYTSSGGKKNQNSNDITCKRSCFIQSPKRSWKRSFPIPEFIPATGDNQNASLEGTGWVSLLPTWRSFPLISRFFINSSRPERWVFKSRWSQHIDCFEAWRIRL